MCARRPVRHPDQPRYPCISRRRRGRPIQRSSSEEGHRLRESWPIRGSPRVAPNKSTGLFDRWRCIACAWRVSPPTRLRRPAIEPSSPKSSSSMRRSLWLHSLKRSPPLSMLPVNGPNSPSARRLGNHDVASGIHQGAVREGVSDAVDSPPRDVGDDPHLVE